MLILINCEAGGERRWSPWLACHNLTSAPRLPNYAAIMRRLLPLAEYGVLILTLLQSYSVCLLSLDGPKIHFYLALKSNESTVSNIKVTYSKRNFMLVVVFFSNFFLSLLISIIRWGYLKQLAQKHEHIQSVDSRGNKCLLSTMLRVRRGRG